MFPMPEKRIFPMKNLLHYGSWLITAGVEGSEPTNLVFCRYFERPTQFFYQSSKEWAQGGGRTICTIGSWEVARIRRLCCRDNLSTFTWTQMNCLFPVFRDQDGVSRTYLHRLGMSQRPNSNPASSRIHLGKHTFISSSTLLADTAKYDLGIRIWPGPHWTFGL